MDAQNAGRKSPLHVLQRPGSIEAYGEYCAEFGADVDIKTYSR